MTDFRSVSFTVNSEIIALEAKDKIPIAVLWQQKQEILQKFVCVIIR